MATMDIEDSFCASVPLSSLAQTSRVSDAVRATDVGAAATATAATGGGVRINFARSGPFEPGFPGPMHTRARGDTTTSMTTSFMTMSVQESLENIVDDNGVISVNDLTNLINHQASMKHQYSQLKKLSAIFIGLLLCFGIAGSFAAYRLNQNLKDSAVNDDVLVSKKTRQPLATASTDTVVKANVMTSKVTHKAVEVASIDTTISMDGTLLSRDHAGAISSVVSTSVATTQQALTSLMSDAALRELRVLALTSVTGASIHLNVLGFIRLPPRPCRRSLVKLFTAAGVLMLDGTQLTFDTDVAGVLADAGFESSEYPDDVDGKQTVRRRLLSELSALIGMFNMVGRFSDSALFRSVHPDATGCEHSSGKGVVNDVNTAGFVELGQKFRITAVGYILCHLPPRLASLQNETDWCTDQGAVRHPTVKGLYFNETITMVRDGVAERSALTRVSSWDPLLRTEHEVEDKQMGVVKSASVLKTGRMHDCALGQLSTLPSLFAGLQPKSLHKAQLEADGESAEGGMEDIFVVDIDSFGNLNQDGSKVPRDQQEMRLHMRVWQTNGLWRRFQVTDSKKWTMPKDARPLTWTYERFYDVKEMVAVTSFPADAFQLQFRGADAECTDDAHKLPPLPDYPSNPMSDAFMLMESIESPAPAGWSMDEVCDDDGNCTNPKAIAADTDSDTPTETHDATTSANTSADASDPAPAAAAPAAADADTAARRRVLSADTVEPPTFVYPSATANVNNANSNDDNVHPAFTPENLSDAQLRRIVLELSKGKQDVTDDHADFYDLMRAQLSEAFAMANEKTARMQQQYDENSRGLRRQSTYRSYTEREEDEEQHGGIVNPGARWHPDDVDFDRNRDTSVSDSDDFDDNDDDDYDDANVDPAARRLMRRRRLRRCRFNDGTAGQCKGPSSCSGGTQESGHCGSGRNICCVSASMRRASERARRFGQVARDVNTIATGGGAIARQSCKKGNWRAVRIKYELCGEWPTKFSGKVSGRSRRVTIATGITVGITGSFEYATDTGASGNLELSVHIGASAFGSTAKRACEWVLGRCDLQMLGLSFSFRPSSGTLVATMRLGPRRFHAKVQGLYSFRGGPKKLKGMIVISAPFYSTELSLFEASSR